MGKKALNPDALVKPFGIFSQGTIAIPGRLCFISGQVAVDQSGNLVGKNDIRVQTRQALKNIRLVLEEAGGTIDDVVSVTVFVTNMEHLKAIHEVRGEFWSENYPASTLIQVSRLVDPNYLIEINAIAVID